MTKQELDNLVQKNYSYIESKVKEVTLKSSQLIVKQNNTLDVVGHLYLVLSTPKNLDKMKTEQHFRGMVNNTLYILLSKPNSKYIRDMKVNKSVSMDTNRTYYENIYEEEDCEKELIGQSFDYAINCWCSLGENSDRRLYSLYFEEGYNTVRSLSKRLEISTYAAYNMIKRMKSAISDIAKGISYEEAITKNK